MTEQMIVSSVHVVVVFFGEEVVEFNTYPFKIAHVVRCEHSYLLVHDNFNYFVYSVDSKKNVSFQESSDF